MIRDVAEPLENAARRIAGIAAAMLPRRMWGAIEPQLPVTSSAILASLLVSLWMGRKPTKRIFEMICLYFQGWATAVDLTAHLEKLKSRETK